MPEHDDDEQTRPPEQSTPSRTQRKLEAGAAFELGIKLVELDPGKLDRIPLDDAPLLAIETDVDLLALDFALNDLAEVNKRQATVVELRFFAGLTIGETAEVVGISAATVERDWHAARLWLLSKMTRSEKNGP